MPTRRSRRFNGVVRIRFLLPIMLWCCAVAGAQPAASDPRPMLGPGATKEEVIELYGWPTGQSKAGNKEILNYPQGLVILENGRVDRVNFSPNIPWGPPRPRPGTVAPAPKKTEQVADFWLTNFAAATQAAAARGGRVLVLFNGSDWSPAGRRFADEVALHPEFQTAFAADFVFLRLDYATRVQLPAELREQNAKLRERYGVTVYPTLLVLRADGEVLGTVDLQKEQPGDSYRARVIAAVAELRDLLKPLPPPAPVTATAVPAAAAPAAEAGKPPAGANPADPAVMASLYSARWLVVGGVVAGLTVSGLLFWLVWRHRAPPPATPRAAISARISDAASGVPTEEDLKLWPREKLARLIAAMAETDGYQGLLRQGGDIDLALKRAGENRVRVLVACAEAKRGPVGAKLVRELFASLTAEGVSAGWFVAPGGFAPDARAYANEHGLLPIDGPKLQAMLRDLPPLLVTKVMGRLAERNV